MTDTKDTHPELGLEAAVADAPRTTEPTVFARDGEVYTNSQHVAAYFEKRHDHVLRDIDAILAGSPDLGNLMFQKVSEHSAAANRTIRSFDLTKDGFTLLVMGYTGAKAMPFKLAYIARFNAMEAELRARPKPIVDFSDPAVMLGCFQHLQGQIAEKDRIIAEQGEKVQRLDRIEGAGGSMCISTVAKTLKVRPKDLFARMSAERWIFKRAGSHAWLGYQDKIQAGYLEHREHIALNEMKEERVYTRVLVTGKGLVKLAEILNRPLH